MYNMKINSTPLNKWRCKSVSLMLILFLFFSSAYGKSEKDSLALVEVTSRINLMKIESDSIINVFEQRIERAESHIEEKCFLFKVASALGGITLLTIIGFYVFIGRIVKSKMDSEFQGRRGQLLAIMDANDSERKLKREKRICLVTSADADTTELVRCLGNFDFNVSPPNKVKEYVPLLELDYDILLLYRDKDNYPLTDDLVKLYADNSLPNSVVFLFGNEKPFDLGEIRKRASSATFWTQLYGNLLSAMKYQQIIR